MDAVELIIRARNVTQQAFTEAERELKHVGKEVDSLSSVWTTNVNVLGLVTKATVGVSAGLGAVFAGIAALGVRGSTVSDLRAQFDTLNRSIGQDGPAMLDVLRRATANTVPEFTLLQTTNAALSQGLRLTASDADVLGRVSRVLADRIGGDTAGAYTALTEAMASGRTQGLRNIGVNIDEEAAVRRLAVSLGKEASELTESEKKAGLKVATMARLRDVLKESGDAEFDFADGIDAAKTALRDTLDHISEGIANSPVLATAMNKVGSALSNAFGKDQQKLVSVIVELVGSLAIAAAGAAQFVVGLAQTVVSHFQRAAIAVQQFFLMGAQREAQTLQATLKMYQTAQANGEGQFSTRIAQIQARLDYLNGYNTQLTNEINAGLTSNAKLNEKAEEAKRFLAELQAAMRKAQSETKEFSAGADKGTASLGALGAAADGVAPPLTKAQLEIKKLADAMSGAHALGEAKKLIDALEDVGGVANMGRAELVKLAASATQLTDSLQKGDPAQATMIGRLQAIAKQATLAALATEKLALVPVQIGDSASSLGGYDATRLGPARNISFDAIQRGGANFGLKPIDWKTLGGFAEGGKVFDENGRLLGTGFAKSFGETIRTQLGSVILGAFQGGGNVGQSIGGFLGGSLGKSLQGGLGDFLTKNLGKTLGGAFGSVIPGLGTLLGGLAGQLGDKLLSGLFKTEGKKVNDLRDQFLAQFGGGGTGEGSGFHTLAAQLHEIGASGDAMFQRLIKASKENDFNAAMETINRALDAHKTKQAEVAEAATKTAEAQQAALDEIATKYDGMIGKLKGELDSFADDLAAEQNAPEFDELGNRIYGVIETQQMARKAQIDAEIAGLEEQKNAEIDAKKETFDQMLEAGKTVDQQLRDIFATPHDFPIRWTFTDELPEPGRVGVGHAVGAYVREDHYARVHAGEIVGPVDFIARAMAKAGAMGGSGTPIVIHNVMNVDGRVMAENQVRYQGRVLAPYGIG